jgi:hypothetical protein
METSASSCIYLQFHDLSFSISPAMQCFSYVFISRFLLLIQSAIFNRQLLCYFYSVSISAGSTTTVDCQLLYKLSSVSCCANCHLSAVVQTVICQLLCKLSSVSCCANCHLSAVLFHLRARTFCLFSHHFVISLLASGQ